MLRHKKKKTRRLVVPKRSENRGGSGVWMGHLVRLRRQFAVLLRQHALLALVLLPQSGDGVVHLALPAEPKTHNLVQGAGPAPPARPPGTHLSLLALSSLSRSCSSSLLVASRAPSDSCRSLRRVLISLEWAESFLSSSSS